MKKLVVLDPKDPHYQRMIRLRRLTGADRFDEVWNGVYVMSPLADNEHQDLATYLSAAIIEALARRKGVRVANGANITDRETDWKKNFRIPDILVFLPGNPAQDRGTHYLGGPEFAAEIFSLRDRSRKKFAFYAGVGVHELLLVNRDPWALELFRRQGGPFESVGRSDLSRPDVLSSRLLPLSFRLLPGDPRPQIEATRPEDGQTWLI